VFLVRQPVGMGKTRAVLKHILKGAKESVSGWSRRLRKLIILGPNDHVERTWRRELLLLACAKLDAKIADVRWTPFFGPRA
jgi:hypothetical protein